MKKRSFIVPQPLVKIINYLHGLLSTLLFSCDVLLQRYRKGQESDSVFDS
jgi:hypothetical protein